MKNNDLSSGKHKQYWYKTIVLLLVLSVLVIGIMTVTRLMEGPLLYDSEAAGRGMGKSTTTVSVAPDVKRIPVDTITTVRININSVAGIVSYEFSLTFNPATVEVLSVTDGGYFTSVQRTANPLGPIIDNAQGRVTFGAYTIGSGPQASGKGTLAVVTSRTKQLGKTDLILDKVTLVNSQDQVLTQKVVNSNITVTR